ncbi:MAG: hypothetical protein U0572_03240 [Phycisphaerales bacterium]
MRTAPAGTRCITCDYSLAEIPAAHDCPECGSPVAASIIARVRREHGRDDWLSVAMPLLRAALLVNGAAIAFTIPFALPRWFALPVTLPRPDADWFVALAAAGSWWATTLLWLAVVHLTRADFGAAQTWIRWFAIVAPSLDAIARTVAFLGPNATWDDALRTALVVTSIGSAAAFLLYARRLTRGPLVDRFDTRRRGERYAFGVVVVFAVLAISLLIVGGAAPTSANMIGPNDGYVLLAQIAVVSALVRRLGFVARAVGAQSDFAVVPRGWSDATTERRGVPNS